MNLHRLWGVLRGHKGLVGEKAQGTKPRVREPGPGFQALPHAQKTAPCLQGPHCALGSMTCNFTYHSMAAGRWADVYERDVSIERKGITQTKNGQSSEKYYLRCSSQESWEVGKVSSLKLRTSNVTSTLRRTWPAPRSAWSYRNQSLGTWPALTGLCEVEEHAASTGHWLPRPPGGLWTMPWTFLLLNVCFSHLDEPNVTAFTQHKYPAFPFSLCRLWVLRLTSVHSM